MLNEIVDFLTVKNEIQKAIGKIRAAKAKATKMKAEREALARAPGTVEDAVQLAMSQIREQASKYPARLIEQFQHCTTAGRPSMSGPGGGVAHIGVFAAREHVSNPSTPNDVATALCFFMLDMVGEDGEPFLEGAIRRAFTSKPWPSDAQPLEGREAVLQDMDRKIAELDAAAAELRQSAASAGVVV